ncbi:MAG: hypothetical protein IJW25_01310, partial [Clostridia bacterium]|nr:hypothetical protein [Clostridia bacterium]
KYLQYMSDTASNTKGYYLQSDMITGAYSADKEYLEGSTYIINTTPRAETIYKVTETISITYTNFVTNNYNISSESGSIELLPEELTFAEIPPLTYNGKERLNDIEINYTNEQGESLSLTKATETATRFIVATYLIDENGNIDETSPAVLRNAGTYRMKMEINTAFYYVQVVILTKAINTFSNVDSWDKIYDGTTAVKNNTNDTILRSADICEDDIASVEVTATYSDFLCGERLITFVVANKEGFTNIAENYTVPVNIYGTIKQKPLSLDLGEQEWTYSPDNCYSVDYAGSPELASSDTLSSKAIIVELLDNNVGEKTLNNKTAIFHFVYNEAQCFQIKQGDIDVTECYSITISGSLRLIAKEFTVEFKQSFESNVFNNFEKSYTVDVIKTGFNEEELSLIKSALTLQYQLNGTTLASAPKDVGVYKVIVIYSGSDNYKLAGNNYEEYTIIPYEYTATEVDVIKKQFATDEPELVLEFETSFDYKFSVTFDRESGEEIGLYDLIYDTTNVKCKVGTDNIVFIADESVLEDKFEIIQNTGTVLITITGPKDGNSLTRYYGASNIGKFYINQLEYTASIGGDTVKDGIDLSEESKENNIIIYNSGDVGSYGISAWQIDTSKTNYAQYKVVCEDDAKLIIASRTVEVSADYYDKYYDGTTHFLGTLSYNFNINSAVEGELSEDEINAIKDLAPVSIAYSKASTGAQSLSCNTLTDKAKQNFNIKLAQEQGEIKKLKVTVVPEKGQKCVYGSLINIEYTVAYGVEVRKEYFTAEQLKGLVSVTIDGINNISSSGYVKAGIYNITAKANENLEIINEITETFTVSKKDITVEVTPEISKVQDGSTDINLNNYNINLNGALEDDEVIVLSANFDNDKAGDNKTIKFTLGGADCENYLQSNTITGSITERQITFNFVYYGYEGCNEFAKAETITNSTITSLKYNYYSSIKASKTALPQPVHTQGGITFDGWSLDGLSIIDLNASISSYVSYPSNPENDQSWIVNLYAVWTTNIYVITLKTAKYNFNNGNYEVDGALTKLVSLPYNSKLEFEQYIEE